MWRLYSQVKKKNADKISVEIFRFNILPMPEEERQQAFKEAVNHCPLCSDQLKFDTEIDYLSQKITEHCYCNQCNLEIRTEKFDLQ